MTLTIAGMPDDDEGYPVPDMISEAKSTLKARLADLAPKFAASPAVSRGSPQYTYREDERTAP